MPTPDDTMKGKVCLVTGATNGIGRVTAEALAAKGATVVLIGRDQGRCDTAVREIRERTGNAAVEAIVADLSSLAEVRRAADEFLARHQRLDVLVNNAGAMFTERQETVDGIERTFALNHLAPFVLTDRLLDTLKASAPARVVTVSSDAHRMLRNGLDWDDLEYKKRYKGFRAYSASKLANILFTRELARRLEGTGVTANALHPGFVATNFFQALRGPVGFAMRSLAGLISIRPEKGAETSIYLASSPEVEGVTGRYFEKSREATPTPAARDDDAARRLWEVSRQRAGSPAAATS